MSNNNFNTSIVYVATLEWGALAMSKIIIAETV
jgi:hypothetical protein